jgi:ubiquinol-cytochrome c reductase cytochrome c subunit
MNERWTHRRVRLLIVGLVPLGFVAQAAMALGAQSSSATSDSLRGRLLYEQSCMSCHGPSASGTSNGPSLQGVGAADIDFMLSSGRMPLADPRQAPSRHPPAFDPGDIAAIVSYLRDLAPGGPAIPSVDPSAGVLADGQEQFASNCAACHGAGAGGDAIGGGQSAPSLYRSTPTQVGEAVRLGPGQMPRFDSRQLSDQKVASIAAYVGFLQRSGNRGGFGLGRIGPVAEGLVGAVVGLGLIVLLIRLTGTR